MRVITGKYKGRRFEVPHTFKARPTTDFAKENLFNVLKQYVDFEECATLDLFAGTGSISLEFLSRGCPRVVSVEKDFQHCSFIRSVCQKLNDPAWSIVCYDVMRYVPKCPEAFDIIFADPPYALANLKDLPELMLSNQVLKAGGLFVLEHGKDYNFESHPAFVEHRSWGSVNFSIFRKPQD